MTPSLLCTDCEQCAALCCVTPAFDNSEEFAIDKPNCTPCPHLEPDNQCRIHGQRREKGFGGCIVYDCNGAGQRVTQEVFGGRSWRDHPDLLPAMARAFTTMCEIHRLAGLLVEAQKMPLDAEERQTADKLLQELVPSKPWTEELLSLFDRSDGADRVQTFLQSLARHVAP